MIKKVAIASLLSALVVSLLTGCEVKECKSGHSVTYLQTMYVNKMTMFIPQTMFICDVYKENK